jgi:catechol 2,3-dioxygenase-like lactoylglutathione lyase family enzyme
MLMNPSKLNPILNVSNYQESVDWFRKLGWREAWRWGDPPDFGGVKAGNCEIFLCQGAHGGRGRGPNSVTFGPNGDETSDKGVWMSVWVDDVDEVYERCLAQGIEVTSRPTNHPWNVREMHVRHPDGHVFRISRHLRKGERAP